MVKWMTRVYVGLIAAYIDYIMVIAGVHAVCACLR